MNTPLKVVCKKHNINFSSAKNVIAIYKKEGRLVKKVRRMRRKPVKNGPINENNTSSSDEEEEEDKNDQIN